MLMAVLALACSDGAGTPDTGGAPQDGGVDLLAPDSGGGGDGPLAEASTPDSAVADSGGTQPDIGGTPDGPSGCTHPKVVKNCSGGWCEIPPGCFKMGSTKSESCRLLNEDLHQVRLTRTFLIMEAEVTQAQYKALIGTNPSDNAACGTNCPVDKVNWHEAAAYCNALSAQKGYPGCYSCNGSGSSLSCSPASAYSGDKIYSCSGYRLPTEAEWEYAYRAGTTTSTYNGDVGTCSGSDTVCDAIGWHTGNAKGVSHPVKQKTPNAWGLYDMAGNVYEWCHDLYADYLGTAAVTDPGGPAIGSARNKRGGSYNYTNRDLRAARRSNGTAPSHFPYVGFRVVRSKIAPPPDGGVPGPDGGPAPDSGGHTPQCGSIATGKFILQGNAMPGGSVNLSYSNSTYSYSSSGGTKTVKIVNGLGQYATMTMKFSKNLGVGIHKVSDFSSVGYVNTMFPKATCTFSTGKIIFDQVPAGWTGGYLVGCMQIGGSCGSSLAVQFNVKYTP
jgi:formylglycine-generating enzyme required for sulfatase activity